MEEEEKEMGTDGSVVNDEEHKLASGTDTNGHDVLNSSGDNSEPETKQISKGTSRGKKEKRKGDDADKEAHDGTRRRRTRRKRRTKEAT